MKTLFTQALAAAAILALAGFATGCTYGAVVDANFNYVNNTHGDLNADITFVQLDDNMNETGKRFTFPLNGQPLVSFDSYAANGASNPHDPQLKNVSEAIPPGNYYVLYFNPTQPFSKSNNFVHNYDGNCADFYTNQPDKLCEEYYFQLISDASCTTCGGRGCPPPAPLPTHGGTKVIQICEPIAHQ